MVANIAFNPYKQTGFPGTFYVDSDGYIQGQALPDPVVRYALCGGTLAYTETLPMVGGIGITENVPVVNGAPYGVLGGIIGRATQIAPGAGQLNGFSVFDQNYSAVITPSSNVPSAASGMQVNFYRLGSGARIPVAMDPSLVDLEGNVITSPVSWDFALNRLQPYVASGPTESVTSMTWTNTNGGQAALVMAAPSVYGLGDTVNISGATNTGTGGNAAVNGAFVIVSYTDSTHFSVGMPASSGVIATIGGTIVLNVGTGLLPVRVLSVKLGNCMTALYNPATMSYSWNRNDSCAVILL